MNCHILSRSSFPRCRCPDRFVIQFLSRIDRGAFSLGITVDCWFHPDDLREDNVTVLRCIYESMIPTYHAPDLDTITGLAWHKVTTTGTSAHIRDFWEGDKDAITTHPQTVHAGTSWIWTGTPRSALLRCELDFDEIWGEKQKITASTWIMNHLSIFDMNTLILSLLISKWYGWHFPIAMTERSSFPLFHQSKEIERLLLLIRSHGGIPGTLKLLTVIKGQWYYIDRVPGQIICRIRYLFRPDFDLWCVAFRHCMTPASGADQYSRNGSLEGKIWNLFWFCNTIEWPSAGWLNTKALGWVVNLIMIRIAISWETLGIVMWVNICQRDHRSWHYTTQGGRNSMWNWELHRILIDLFSNTIGH
jgi:hypothetical protein